MTEEISYEGLNRLRIDVEYIQISDVSKGICAGLKMSLKNSFG
jgi:hypothetical protein